MTPSIGNDAALVGHTLRLLRETRARSLSRREWQHVLRGYGYDLRKTASGMEVLKLPQNIPVCDLPADLCA